MWTRRQTLCASALTLFAAAGCAQAPSMAGWPMPANAKPSVTYLRLLTSTPFFVGLSEAELQWLIDHSREWSVPEGSEITTAAQAPDNFWVLLDGGWRIERGSTVLAAGKNDPATWYGGAELPAVAGGTRLIATAPSYVMNIRWADVQALRQRAPLIETRLQAGLAAYRAAFK